MKTGSIFKSKYCRELLFSLVEKNTQTNTETNTYNPVLKLLFESCKEVE